MGAYDLLQEAVVASSLEDQDAEYGGARPGRPSSEFVTDVTRPDERA